LRDLLGGFGDEAWRCDILGACLALRPWVGELAALSEPLGDDLVGGLAVEDALVAGVTMPLVWGEYGLVWRYSAPSSAQTLAKAGVKQLPLSVSTWVRRKGKAAAASRRKAMALRSVSSSLTARWTEREHRSMAT
jgi:hypothetical protein